MLFFEPLLADVADVIKAIVPLIVLVIWVLSQVLGQKAKAGPGPVAGGGAGKNDRAQGGLRQEIERFLREAREEAERQQQKKQQPRQQPTAAEIERRRQQKQEKQRRKQERQRDLARQRGRDLADKQVRPTQPERIEAIGTAAPPASVAQHVSEYMDSSQFAQRASQLGQQVGLADDRLEARLQQTFGHQVGHLGTPSTEVDRGGAAVVHTVVGGAQLAAQLINPQNFRTAVILNEILTRPADRWK